MSTIKRGDQLPALTLTLTDDSTSVDLTTATAVRLIIRARGDNSSAAAYLDTTLAARPADGVLTYDWGATDTATVGTYNVEVEVTWPGGLKQTFPGQSYAQLRIVPDLG